MDGRLAGWRAFAIVSAVVLYAVSVSGQVYDLTSPVTLPHHELYRKTYAVLAFALLGFAFERSHIGRLRGVLAAGTAVALYSYAIELGQIAIDHSTETFGQHAFDVASGLAGGALGAFVTLIMTAPGTRGRRIEAAFLAVAFVVLAWGFSVTYGRLA